MLSVVGTALKRINGVKDPSKSSTPPGQVNKRDSVPQYQPTPIHILKAKSIGSSCKYDPVSNYSASTSRVTLSSCNKRPHSSDTAVIATKRSKLLVDSGEIEAKFSGSEDEQTVGQTSIPASSIIDAPGSNVSAKCKGATFAKTKSSFTNHQANSSGNNAAKMLSTNLAVTASTTKLSAAQSVPKSSSYCISSSESQTNVTASSNHLKSAKMPSAVLNKDNGSVKQHSSNSKAVVGGSEKLHTNKDHVSSSQSSGTCINENTDNKNNDNGKTLKTEHRHHGRHSSQSSVTSARKHGNKDGRKDDRPGTRTASDEMHSGEHSCNVVVGESRTERHSSDKHREQSTCNKSEQNNKPDATSNESQKEKLPCETSADKHRSKTNVAESSVNKHTSSHRHSKEHRTSHHKDGKHNQSDNVANSQHRSLKGESYTESCQSKTAPASSNKETRSSHHRPRESGSKTGRHHAGHVDDVGKSRAESKTATSVSSTVTKAGTKRVGAVLNIDLFGEDSDTESNVLQPSSVSAQISVKQNELLLHSRSSASSHTSQSSDDVILLPTDDLSDADDVTFEQCHQLFNDLARQQQSRPAATCTSVSIHSVSCLLSLIFDFSTFSLLISDWFRSLSTVTEICFVVVLAVLILSVYLSDFGRQILFRGFGDC